MGDYSNNTPPPPYTIHYKIDPPHSISYTFNTLTILAHLYKAHLLNLTIPPPVPLNFTTFIILFFCRYFDTPTYSFIILFCFFYYVYSFDGDEQRSFSRNKDIIVLLTFLDFGFVFTMHRRYHSSIWSVIQNSMMVFIYLCR